MGTTFTVRAFVMASLFLYGTASSAFTLGPLTGSAAVGSPLQVRAAVVAAPGEPAQVGCVSAQVMYGDAALPAGAVRAFFEPAASGTGGTVRIAAAASVNEPVVTVVVHAGCSSRVSRQYVVLAEAPVPAATAPVAAATPAAILGAAPAVMPAARMVPAPRTMRPPAPRAVAAAPATATEGSSWLRLSPTLASTPSEGSQRAVAAAMWKAVSAQPEDLLLMSSRLRQLEGEVGTLQARSSLNRIDVDTHRADLRAVRERYRTDMAIGAALLVAAALAAGLFWFRGKARRNRPVPAWSMSAYDSMLPRARVEPRDNAPSGFFNSALPEIHELAPVAELPARTALPAGDPAAQRIQALVEVSQEAEFFKSIGQNNEAIALLEGFLAADAGPALMVYLELFALYHALHRRSDFAALRGRFAADFGFDAPDFDTFNPEAAAAGLEAYPQAHLRLAASWSGDQALSTIESLLFERPRQLRDALSPQACRELAWLHTFRHGLARGGDDTLATDSVLPWDAVPERFARG